MISLLDAVDERAPLDRYATAGGLDPRMGHHAPRLHRQVELDDVAARPRALETQVAGRRAATRRLAGVDSHARSRAPAGHPKREGPRARDRLLEREPDPP